MSKKDEKKFSSQVDIAEKEAEEIAKIESAMEAAAERRAAQETPFDGIDYFSLVTIKGESGIYFLVSKPNKSSLQGAFKWNDIYNPNRKTITVKAEDVKPLMNVAYATNDNKLVWIRDMFINLYKHEESLPNDDLGIEDFDLNDENTVNHLMSVAVPDHTDDFKPYHLKSLIKLYTWAKEAMAEIVDWTIKLQELSQNSNIQK